MTMFDMIKGDVDRINSLLKNVKLRAVEFNDGSIGIIAYDGRQEIYLDVGLTPMEARYLLTDLLYILKAEAGEL